MNKITPAIDHLSRRLIAIEAARESSEEPIGITTRACGRLQAPIAKLVGSAGFRSLLSRALAMAKAEIPSLNAIHAEPGGSLKGFDGIGRAEEAEVGVVIVAQLLGLLVIFIGEPLMLHLVRDAWPDATLDETALRGEGRI